MGRPDIVQIDKHILHTWLLRCGFECRTAEFTLPNGKYIPSIRQYKIGVSDWMLPNEACHLAMQQYPLESKPNTSIEQ